MKSEELKSSSISLILANKKIKEMKMEENVKNQLKSSLF